MKLRPALACSALLLSLAAPAFAQEPAAQTPLPPAVGAAARASATPEMTAARRAMRQACSADIATLCADTTAAAAPAAGAEPGQRGGARMQCLRGHVAQVSAPCRQALAAMRDARKAARS